VKVNITIDSRKRFCIGAPFGAWICERDGATVLQQQNFWRTGKRALWLTVLLSGITTILSAQPPISVNAYSSDQAGRITTGPDGALWFTETVAGRIGRITTAGIISEYALANSNSYPFGITTGPDGALWFTEVQAQQIGRITTDGSVTEYPVSGTPTTSFLSDITAGPDGALWFTKWCTGISRITTAGEITDYLTASCPTGITTGPDGAIWFSDAVGGVGRITIDGILTLYPLPTYYLHSIAVGPDKALWFTADVPTVSGPVSPTIGRITTGGLVTKYTISDGFPFLITEGPDAALWFTFGENAYNVGRIATSGITTTIPIGGQCLFPVNPFNGIVGGESSDLWLACSSGGIVQVSLPDLTPPLITVWSTPTALWPPNGRMVPVTVSGTISDVGSGVSLSSAAYSVTDEYGEVQPTGAISLGDEGAYSFTVLLQASRHGNDRDGRRYTITVRAKDSAGSSESKSAVVTVPHDQGK
jgi:virginiamycin B lyase